MIPSSICWRYGMFLTTIGKQKKKYSTFRRHILTFLWLTFLISAGMWTVYLNGKQNKKLKYELECRKIWNEKLKRDLGYWRQETSWKIGETKIPSLPCAKKHTWLEGRSKYFFPHPFPFMFLFSRNVKSCLKTIVKGLWPFFHVLGYRGTNWIR